MIITQNGPQNIGQVRTHFQHGNLFLSPVEYQREGVWKADQKRLLIDTIFQRMDIPKFYLWKIDRRTLAEGYPEGDARELYKKVLDRKSQATDDPDPYVYEVVDGQQRLRTILEFMGQSPPTTDVYRGRWEKPFPSMETTPVAKGKPYTQLNPEQQIRFDENPLTIMVLEQAAIDEVRDMFLRLQNGTPLNAQQKRDAMGSHMGQVARELAELPFFKQSVGFGNSYAAYHLVTSQMLHLEHKGAIVSCASQQLDKIYGLYKGVLVERETVAKAKKVVTILGNVFPTKNPNLNRSYALSLYWLLSRMLNSYNIPEAEYTKIKTNFDMLDLARLEAMDRGYSEVEDEVYSELSVSMSHGTDGKQGITTRHDILSQFLYKGVGLVPLTSLDPRRNFTHEEALLLYGRAGGMCQIECNGTVCGRSIEFDDAVVDHIQPHSKGGTTTLENGRIAYRVCNSARGNRDNFDPATMCHLLADSSESNTG